MTVVGTGKKKIVIFGVNKPITVCQVLMQSLKFM